ncbi:MAG TPA: excalibur calcium-binding domain-containing protein [Candidatus Levybacteria bacterium]|nr:excalibur calcium-binding domain-containing protein [Candidatus Levybacteria bacterium]
MHKSTIIGIALTICLMLGLLWIQFNTINTTPRITNPNFENIPPAKTRCSDFYSHNDAQIFFENQKNNNNNYSHLDKDNDGIVCEGL